MEQNPTINDNSEERKEFRRSILADYIELYQDANKGRKAVIVLGQIASGKSSFCKKLAGDGRNVIVDVDFIKQGHGMMEGLKKDFDEGRGVEKIHEEASMLSKEYLKLMSGCGYNLVIPKTGINYDSIESIASLLKERGYTVMLCYIDLPIKKCIERNVARFVDEYRRGLACRLVPLSVIEKIDNKPFRTFAKFLENSSPLIDRYCAFSNDDDFTAEMKRIDIDSIRDYIRSWREKNEENER